MYGWQQHGRSYVGHILRGYSLKDGIAEPVHSLQRHYRGRAGHALTAALKDLHIQFEQLNLA